MAERDVGAAGDIDGSGLRVVLITTRWNPEIVARLAAGATHALAATGVTDVTAVEVPGAFELPFAARSVAASGRADAIVAIGAVIRGETTHYELVSQGCAQGLQQAQLASGVPIGFGVLATETVDQALARSGDVAGGATAAERNVGADAAWAAVEMAQLARDWS